MIRLTPLLFLTGLATLGAAQTDCLLEADIVVSTEIWADEISWNLYGDDGNLIASGSGYENNSEYVTTVCLEDSCYTLELLDTFGDGWNGASISVNFSFLGIMLGPLTMDQGDYAAYSVGSGAACDGSPIDGTGGGGNGINDTYGCMDPAALNYDSNATVNCCCQYPVDCSASNTLTIIQPAAGDSLVWGPFAQFTVIGADGFPWYPAFNGLDDSGNWILEGCLDDGCYNLSIWSNNFFGLASTILIEVNGILQETITIPADQYIYETALGINVIDCEFMVMGCTDPEAPNYNPDANQDDGSCLEPCDCPEIYEPVCGYDYFTGQTVTFDNLCELECAGAYIQWEGDCANPPVYGCLDPDALNYDPDATADSGWCVYMPDCGDDYMVTTSSGASTDSIFGGIWGGSVTGYFSGLDGYVNDFIGYSDEDGNYIQVGCLEEGCYNFHVYSNTWTFGGSIDVSLDGGDAVTFTLDDNQYEAVFPFGAGVDDCEVFILGCTDPEALNYNPSATEDDGSCAYPFFCPDSLIAGQLYVCTFSAGNEVSLTIVDSQGDVLYSQDGFPDLTIDYIDVCLDPEECYTAIMSNNAGGDSWNGGYFWIQAQWTEWVNGALYGATTDTIEFGMADDCGDDIGGNDVWGCTDPTALNYNPSATINDGSCIYDGTDSSDCGDDNFVAGIYFPGDPFVDEVGWAILDTLGNVMIAGDGGSTTNGTIGGVTQGCLPDGCYTVEVYDSFGDGWGGGLLVLTAGDIALTFTLEEGEFASFPLELGAGCGGSPLTIWGCTDPGASNYDPDANADDGSCDYAFCPLIEVTFLTYILTDGEEVSWTVSGTDADTGDPMSVESGTMADFSINTHTMCMAEGCYEMTLHDTGGDGWNDGWLEIWVDGEMVTATSYAVDGTNTMTIGFGTDCSDEPGVSDGTTNSGMSGWDDTVDFSIYPTPTGEIVNVLGEGFDNESPVVVRIKDMMGKLVAERTVMPTDGPAGWIFSVRDWPAGIYTAEGIQGDKMASGKILVSH